VRACVCAWYCFEEAGACCGWGGKKGCVWTCTHTRACREDGRSPLHAASYGGHDPCVEALIRSKADVLQCDK
jgi:hypothetical protein